VPNPGPRQLYPSKPHFRQSYAFSGATPDGPKAFDDAFQTPKPASLCFNCGKIIVYGTCRLLFFSIEPMAPGAGRLTHNGALD
jgi:hypothetical protein